MTKLTKEEFQKYRARSESCHGISYNAGCINVHYSALTDYQIKVEEIEKHRQEILRLSKEILDDVVFKFNTEFPVEERTKLIQGEK